MEVLVEHGPLAAMIVLGLVLAKSTQSMIALLTKLVKDKVGNGNGSNGSKLTNFKASELPCVDHSTLLGRLYEQHEVIVKQQAEVSKILEKVSNKLESIDRGTERLGESSKHIENEIDKVRVIAENILLSATGNR